jgi:diguanylate cyclase (GGDEF)-like protein
MIRLFMIYAAISLAPVLILGAVLAASYRSDAHQRGLAEGRSEAALVAQTAVEPLLTGHLLSEGLTATEFSGLERLSAVRDRTVVRLRLRDLQGRVVYSDDGSGMTDEPDDEALEALAGEAITKLTHLNADSNDTGASGIAVVEIYRVLMAGSPARAVGVLELYLPYSPIEHDVTAGLTHLYRDLVIGLALLWLVLFGVCVSVTRGLRRQVTLTTFLAEHDSLTGLPNRTLFHRRAEVALAEAAQNDAPVAIAIIDLNRFREINDTLGHQSGDRVLIELARRLKCTVSDGDTVARLGGDEFGLILHGVTDAAALSRRLWGVLDHDVEVDGLRLAIEASIGFVVATEDGSDAEELLQRADVAMYIAKVRQIGVLRYDAGDDHYDAENLSLIAELRRGIDAGELVLHYQPQTRVIDGHVEAVEALVRWRHPLHGMLGPDRFIPLAEKTDLMDKLTMWVLTAALTEVRDLGPLGADLSVAVNVSARDLARAHFAEHVVETLDRLGVPARRLVVELTETALLTDPIRAASVLAELAAAGVKISLDDFGCGQTSLGYLSALPLHELKIDRSFVGDMTTDKSHDAIVRSIIDLGHNLGLRVVGEGVETNGVLLRLRAAGCDVAQGYLFARPMPIDQLTTWLVAVPVEGAVSAWSDAISDISELSGIK